jgi:hypothetical protein
MTDLPQLTCRRSLSCCRALKQTSANWRHGEEAEKNFLEASLRAPCASRISAANWDSICRCAAVRPSVEGL